MGDVMSYNPFTRQSNTQSLGRFNQNQTGMALPKGTPVKITSSGISTIDVSQEADIDALGGVLKEDAPDSSKGNIITSGSVENLSTPFAVGTSVFISKLGTLTNIKPSVGVNGFGEGDFVVLIGMIAVNVDNPGNKDLLVRLQVVGQL